MEKPWWVDKQYCIYDAENTDTYVSDLMGRRHDDGSWEYALVRWRYRIPHTIFIVQNGKLVEEESVRSKGDEK